jgi:hypothetical protein
MAQPCHGYPRPRTRIQMILCALVLCMAGATLLYLASAKQTLLARTLSASAHVAALALMAGGIATWIAASGTGAGIAAALTTWMLSWVALPYLAWWRQAAAATRAGGR